ncbi:MAG: adenylyl-sulfate kinase [Ignavibacteria bacterium]
MSGTNIIPHIHNIKKSDRNILLKNKSLIIWFTGLSGSGKSTLANNLEVKLFNSGILPYTLDGDNIRTGLNKDLGFTDIDRKENIRRTGELCKLMVDAGIIVLTAFISPFKNDRKLVRDMVNDNEFIEIFVDCPIEKCEERDVKGLYSKSRLGEIKNFTGIDSPYEAPENPELTIDTSTQTIEECSEKIFAYIKPLLKLNN